MIIQPTVGRIVWFVPAGGMNQPFAAIVTYVHHDRMVNLAVFDHDGVMTAETSVQLIQEGDERPSSYFCEWMPYQIGQAKKQKERDNGQ